MATACMRYGRPSPPNNGMHPTPLKRASHARRMGARVMPGVSPMKLATSHFASASDAEDLPSLQEALPADVPSDYVQFLASHDGAEFTVPWPLVMYCPGALADRDRVVVAASVTDLIRKHGTQYRPTHIHQTNRRRLATTHKRTSEWQRR